ncbi:type VI protein secretion system component VasA [Paraburkholderia sp. GAS33]
MHVDPVPTPPMVPGIQITITIDEAAFAGDALYTFAQLMERWFLRYASRDYMELVMASHRGDRRCAVQRYRRKQQKQRSTLF